ncbi:MAG: metallophosphoesterase [Candidatus Excrementavichristensenella sp.]|jgi:predicted phosphohydrolase|nr:metallophosphoesterase [Bacillota bacterium]NLL55248.1 phosphohydrolase [Clostridiales bacterium]
MIFAVSDLHLSSGEKPMDVFGPHWAGHFSRIREDWKKRVAEKDIVLLPGDLSWAMKLEEACAHLREIGELPGRKIILKGNHDYWWNSISRVRRCLPEGMYALQNDCLFLDGVLFAGTRGWILPGPDARPEDERIYLRELIRLEMSLRSAREVSGEAPLVCMMHFPPRTATLDETGFTELLERYRAAVLVYGHLHGPALKAAFQGEERGVLYKCVSCDGLDFTLAPVPIDEG